MKKLRLELDELRVESFATVVEDPTERGTVDAHGILGSRDESVCVCDTTHTQRIPECDPSAESFCFDTRCCDGP